ncbi:MAG: ComF family protein, partial [bacterium]|nr:ComF family protein [bacterium]
STCLKKNLLLTLFVCQCKLCGNDLVREKEEIVCSDCIDKISMFRQPLCDRCGRPQENRHALCGECIVNPPPYKQHLSFAAYKDQLRELLLIYKYAQLEGLADMLSEYYVRVFKMRLQEDFDFIVPVPADKGRKRSFDPMLEITRLMSKQLEIPLLGNRLIKIKQTAPQAGLSRSKRLKNLNGAFKLTLPLKDKKILLVDDVYTTGTTIKKCTERFTKEGSEVVALTLARSL